MGDIAPLADIFGSPPKRYLDIFCEVSECSKS